MTSTVATPAIEPLVAVAWNEPAVAPAVKSPACVIVPPVALQVGVTAMGLPFWSRPCAESWTWPPVCTAAGFGVTAIWVSV